MYQSFIKSNFNFCPIIWHFCGQTDTKKLEKMNYRALRHVYKDFTSTYEELLARDSSVSLQLQRQRQIAVEVYKIMNGLCPVYLRNLIPSIKESANNLGKRNVSLPDFRKITYGKTSFRFHGSQIWSSLPNCIQTPVNIRDFKTLNNDWDGAKCGCSSCRILN